jgi:hypothetical protein
MADRKTDILSVLIVIIAWFVAIALAWLVYAKIKMLLVVI